MNYKTTSPATQGSTGHRGAVITPREICYGNGTARAALDGLCRNLVGILDGTLNRFARHCTVVVDGVKAADLRDQSDAARAAGWQHAQIDAWTLFHRDDGRTVALGLRDSMNVLHLGVLFDKATDPAVLAVALDRYHRVSGNPWRGTPATSAHNAIRLSWENSAGKPLWQQPKLPVRSGVGFCSWSRPLNENELWWGYVHTFDANNAYLGSAANAELAWSQLHHTGPQQFDASLPGYWLVDLSTDLLAHLADPLRPPLVAPRNGQVWMTTPYAKLLEDFGYHGLILDSWTGREEFYESGKRKHPAGARILRKWAETVRDGLPAKGTPVGDAARRTYKDAVGGMQKQGMRISRTDWGETIIDLWRATLMRRVWRIYRQIGYWPVRIATDSISYADSNPDPRALAAIIHGGPNGHLLNSTALGQFHHEATHTTEQWLERHPVTQGARRPKRRVTS